MFARCDGSMPILPSCLSGPLLVLVAQSGSQRKRRVYFKAEKKSPIATIPIIVANPAS